MLDVFHRQIRRRVGALTVLLSLTTLVWIAPAWAAVMFSGPVVGVQDGDTIEVLYAGRAVKVRLHGIDTPESGQAFGTTARAFTAGLVHRQQVRVVVWDKDRYGRVVAEVQLADGRNLNAELVRAGLAWWYRQYAPQDPTLAQLEAEARRGGRGLWRDPQAVPPWDYRAKEAGTTTRGGGTTTQVGGVTRTAPGERTIHTGPRGGKYYMTDHGTKVYLKKK
jgi:micrococcal nuclease